MSSKADRSFADPEAQRAAPALGLAGEPLLGRQVRAPPDIARRLPCRLLGLAVRVELLGRAVAGVGEVVGEQTLRGRGVARQALHLTVGRVRAAGRLARDFGPLVPGQAQPVQPVEDVLLELERATRDIGVLEAEDEGSTDMPGMEVVEQRRARGADVERAGRARGDADSGDGVGHRPIVAVAPRLSPWGSLRPARDGTGPDRRRPGGRARGRPVAGRASRARAGRRGSANPAIQSGQGS